MQKLKIQNSWEGKGDHCCEGDNTVMTSILPTTTDFAVVIALASAMCLCCVSLKWMCQIQIPPSVKSILLFDFSTRKEKLQLKFIVKLLVFVVMIWTGGMWQIGVMNLMQEERTFIM